MNSHTHAPKNHIFNLELIFHTKLCRKNNTFMIFWGFMAVFNLDLNIIFVMNSHTHSHRKKLGYHLGMIFNEKLCRKNHTFLPFLPIFAVFHYDLNIFLVMNSHTQLFFDFGPKFSK